MKRFKSIIILTLAIFIVCCRFSNTATVSHDELEKLILKDDFLNLSAENYITKSLAIINRLSTSQIHKLVPNVINTKEAKAEIIVATIREHKDILFADTNEPFNSVSFFNKSTFIQCVILIREPGEQ
ncbi:hypothetical protein [Mucilaginibacter paludis]|uniref:Lipoprotein n=1 Tax=Mucilaginibacter paludis DSM 18603 TaxID=714943 RepID=H1Y5M8_9SPHI|nr:hypothetical protein [Mucilaginibacter paludis]EHQ29804.1 hypothetical protein Mucpa_5736 [Mucilaginibacter paludis DSM 18603]